MQQTPTTKASKQLLYTRKGKAKATGMATMIINKEKAMMAKAKDKSAYWTIIVNKILLAEVQENALNNLLYFLKVYLLNITRPQYSNARNLYLKSMVFM